MGGGSGGGGRNGRGGGGGGSETSISASELMGAGWSGPELTGAVKSDATSANILASGNTYQHKDYLKRAGFEYSGAGWTIQGLTAGYSGGVAATVKNTLQNNKHYLKRMKNDVKLEVVSFK